MKLDKNGLEDYVSESEQNEVDKILADDRVMGFAVFDLGGEAVQKSDVSETTVAVVSNLLDIAERVGTELGENAPRPAMMVTGSSVELLALPLNSANFMVLKGKNAIVGKGLRHAN